MNLEEIGAVLAKAAAVDNRTIGEANILAWHEIIGHLDVHDCLAAVTRHRIESPDVYLQPGHVLRLAEQVRKERQEREREHEQRRELEAYRATAGPLVDCSEEIQTFVGQVRNALPDGDIEALAPRREFWRREHQAHQRQAGAEPNPDYDPGMKPVPTWQASKRPAPGPWWTDEAKREADAREQLAAADRLAPRRAS